MKTRVRYPMTVAVLLRLLEEYPAESIIMVNKGSLIVYDIKQEDDYVMLFADDDVLNVRISVPDISAL